jgi:hypothetical protein
MDLSILIVSSAFKNPDQPPPGQHELGTVTVFSRNGMLFGLETRNSFIGMFFSLRTIN